MAITDEVPAPVPAPVPKPSMRRLFHLIAFPVAIVSGSVLMVLAGGTRDVAGATVYAVTCLVLFGCRTLYHRGSWGRAAHAPLRRLGCHAMFQACTNVGLTTHHSAVALAVT